MPILEDQLEKIKRYCAYQERSHSEVRSKLIELNVYGDDLEQTLGVLIEENYLNEERFARALARGKFSLKKWGRVKIKQALKQHRISDYCIRKGLEEIEEERYQKTFNALAEQKWEALRGEKNRFVKMHKLQQFLLYKGYESEYIHEFLNQEKS